MSLASQILQCFMLLTKHVRCARADEELRTQVAQLKDQYAQVGDRLESEQTRIMQARSRDLHKIAYLAFRLCLAVLRLEARSSACEA